MQHVGRRRAEAASNCRCSRRWGPLDLIRWRWSTSWGSACSTTARTLSCRSKQNLRGCSPKGRSRWDVAGAKPLHRKPRRSRDWRPPFLIAVPGALGAAAPPMTNLSTPRCGQPTNRRSRAPDPDGGVALACGRRARPRFRRCLCPIFPRPWVRNRIPARSWIWSAGRPAGRQLLPGPFSRQARRGIQTSPRPGFW